MCTFQVSAAVNYGGILVVSASDLVAVYGCIRTTIGQAELLMAERFKQFAGLVEQCEYGTGEKEITTGDLHGFWDMVYFQVYIASLCFNTSFSCTHTHPFNGPFSGTTWVSRYQKGKTNLDFTEARDGE